MISDLKKMKKDGRKIVGVVAWDFHVAQIAERAGADLISVGDSVGVNLWAQAPDEITIEEMLTVCRAVRRGVKRAVLSVDLPAHEQGANDDAAIIDSQESQQLHLSSVGHHLDDRDVPSERTHHLLRQLRSADVQATFVKQGDHRLSREADIALLIRTIEGL